MKRARQYKQTILDNFYLDDEGQVRRSQDGYHNRFKRGDLASFYFEKDGYAVLSVPKTQKGIRRSHVVLLLSGIDIPENAVVDHKNGITSDDRLDNLRVTTPTINAHNAKMYCTNTSGHSGIHFDKTSNAFIARRVINGKRISKKRRTLEAVIIAMEDLKLMDSTYTSRHGTKLERMP